jgi:uncharacterized iron-regulated membrane protein
VYKDAYWRLVYPELRADGEVRGEHGGIPGAARAGVAVADHAAVEAATGHAAAIAAARARFGDTLRSVKLPEPGVAAYHLYLTDGEAFMGGDHRVIDRWRPTERPMALLFDLHAHLMAGEVGERVVGVIGLLGVLLVVTGVYLWWPARRRFSLRTLIPTGFARRKLLPSHRDLGLLAAPILVLVLLTGSGMVFYGAAGTILNGLLSGRPPVAEGPPELEAGAGRDDGPVAATAMPVARTDEPVDVAAPATADGPVPTASGAMIEAAASAFPGARLVFYYPPDARGIHGFRLKQPCELHPNGRSFVYVGAGGGVLRAVDACDQPAGQRALHAVYPLHAGMLDSRAYELLVFLSGLVLALVSATGAASYIARLRGAR